jgi:hypothetical protein
MLRLVVVQELASDGLIQRAEDRIRLGERVFPRERCSACPPFAGAAISVHHR